jgi:beta-aspartyl-peptidase (threonine type)
LRPSIIIHGGAGSGKFGPADVRFRELGLALEEGLAAMRSGSSLDGVEAAVGRMEQSGVFNAGRGACLTADGKVQLDAAIMDGARIKGAGVGAVTSTFGAVSLARWVMANTNHVLLVGQYTAEAVRAAGLPLEALVPSERARKRFEELIVKPTGKLSENIKVLARMQEGNTVGAVAVDSHGVPAAAVSTGGMWLKLPGRVGDSAILGAGIYADKRTGAACATGTGEEIIKQVLSWRACDLMRRSSAPIAAKRAIAIMSRLSGRGTAGIITVDRKGRVGFGFNTEAMGRAWFDHAKGRTVVQV